MATPEEIEKLLNRLEKAYKQLGTKNPFRNFDTSNIPAVNRFKIGPSDADYAYDLKLLESTDELADLYKSFQLLR